MPFRVRRPGPGAPSAREMTAGNYKDAVAEYKVALPSDAQKTDPNFFSEPPYWIDAVAARENFQGLPPSIEVGGGNAANPAKARSRSPTP